MTKRLHLAAGCVALAALACTGVPATAVAADPPVAPAQPTLPAPSLKDGAYIARLVTRAPARSTPGNGRVVAHVQASTDWSHQSTELMVLGSAVMNGRQWLQVRLPGRPNRSSGWISADRVQLSHTRYWITVQTRQRLVRVYHKGKLVHRYRAVVGKGSTPTPDGLFSIYERNPLSGGGFLGSMALTLTAFSPTLHHFGGGPGRVAIHGRGGASLSDKLGSARSHGCIRLDNRPVNWIADNAPRGTPVEITD
jgi:lipoprotein-anchoring transpeptidase ErfK/SrfK